MLVGRGQLVERRADPVKAYLTGYQWGNVDLALGDRAQ